MTKGKSWKNQRETHFMSEYSVFNFFLGLIYCNYESGNVNSLSQLIEKPELQSRLAFFGIWLNAVGQTNDFEDSFSDIVKKNAVEQNLTV